MKRVRLTALTWGTHAPMQGDLLVTASGRTYLVDEVRTGRVNPFILFCVPLAPADAITALEDPDAMVHTWEWAPRGRSS